MFARKSCYFFVRPRRSFLEVCVFLGRPVKAPQIRRVDPASKSKLVHFIRITHRDEVEAPFTDWLREAYELPDALGTATRMAAIRRAKKKKVSVTGRAAAAKRLAARKPARRARAKRP
jgi:hypothetical protein